MKKKYIIAGCNKTHNKDIIEHLKVLGVKEESIRVAESLEDFVENSAGEETHVVIADTHISYKRKMTDTSQLLLLSYLTGNKTILYSAGADIPVSVSSRARELGIKEVKWSPYHYCSHSFSESVLNAVGI